MFVGHLYVYLGEVSVQVLYYFLIVFLLLLLLLFLLCCMISLYILDIRPLLEGLLADILSHLDDCLFTLLMVSFAVQKLFSLM